MKRTLLSAAFVLFLLIALLLRACSAPVQEGYRIARDPTWYPLDTRGRDKNLVAFTDDILVSVADRQGFKVSLLSVGGENLMPGLMRGDYDGVITSVLPNKMKEETLVFSDSFFFTGPVLVVPVTSTARGLDDMKSLRVGVQTGTTVIFDPEMFPAIVMQPYNTVIQAMEALLRGQVDGLIMDLIPAYTFTEGLYKGSLRVVGKPLTTEGLRLVTSKRGAGRSLIRLFDRGLEELKEQNAYAAFLRKWGLFNHLDADDILDGED